MNIKIFLFSHLEKRKNDSIKSHVNKKDLPSSNKIAKLVKILMANFHEYSKEYFIDYLIKPIKNNFNLDDSDIDLFKQKLLEINSLLISKCKKYYKRNNNSINSIIKKEIKKVTTTNTISSNNRTPNEFNNYSFSNYNNSTLNNIKKKRTNNINSIEANDSFLINYRDLKQFKKDIKIQPKKSNNNFILNLKEINSNTLIRGKLNKYNSSRNCNNNHNHSILNNFQSNSKDKKLNLGMRNIDNFNKKLNNLSNSIKHITLNYPLKNSVTRNNINKTFSGDDNKNIENTLRKKLNSDYYNYSKIYEKSKINNSKTSKDENKENNASLINSNYRINSVLTDYNIPFNHQMNKNNSNRNQEFNPFYTTNTNNINKNYIQKSKNIKLKRPIRVLSSIRKVISQKMNNISPNNSISSNNNINRSNMNKSYNEYKKHFSNNELSNASFRKFFKINSQNKKEEYITPRKKKLYYYYH